MNGQKQSSNQIYDAPSGKSSPQSVGEPPAIGYGAQGMRGRLYRLGSPTLQSKNQISRQAISLAAGRIKP